MSLFFRCLNPPTMASHLRALLMLLWWVYILLYIPRLLNEIFILSFTHGIHSNPGFVWRVQSSEVEEQEPTDFCLHINFPGGKPAICSNFTARLKHWLQLKDLCLNLQNVVHTFAKLRVNIGDFKVTSKLFCTLWPMCWLLKEFWCKLTNLGDSSDWPR